MEYSEDKYIHKSMYQRLRSLWYTKEWNDCSFSVGGRIFKAHKLILSMTSPVFKAMFYGPLQTNDVVEIIDIHPDIFEKLLAYIYTDLINFSSMDEAFGILYAGKKYMIEGVVESCRHFIEGYLDIDNTLDTLKLSDFIQEPELFNKAFILFCAHPDYLIKHFKEEISLSIIKLLLTSQKICLSEEQLIRVVMEWVRFHCQETDNEASIESVRKFLIDNGLMENLHFYSLTMAELDKFLEEKLITSEEAHFFKEYRNRLLPIEDKLLTSLRTPREQPDIVWYMCTRFTIGSCVPLYINRQQNKIHVRLVSARTIFIKSLMIRTRALPYYAYAVHPTDLRYDEHISISIKNEYENKVVTKEQFMRNVEYNNSITVEFTECCAIQKDIWYNVTFNFSIFDDLIHPYHVNYRSPNWDHIAEITFDDVTGNTHGSGSFLEGFKYCL